MKKIITILAVVFAFTFNSNAQDKMMKKETVKTVSLEQTKGEFTQKQITLSEKQVYLQKQHTQSNSKRP